MNGSEAAGGRPYVSVCRMRSHIPSSFIAFGLLCASAHLAIGCSSDESNGSAGNTPDASVRPDSGVTGSGGSTSSGGGSGTGAGSNAGGSNAGGSSGSSAGGAGAGGSDAGQGAGGGLAVDGGQDGGLGPDSIEAEVKQTIGATGGTITLDGATLVFPASAVNADTEITMRRWKNPIPFATYSPRYEFSPAGKTFARPLALTLPFTGKGDARVYWSAPAGGWEYLDGTINGSTITAAVRHFSSGGVGGPGTCDPQGGNTFCKGLYGPSWTCCDATIFGVTGTFCLDIVHDSNNCQYCGHVCGPQMFCQQLGNSEACVACGPTGCLP